MDNASNDPLTANEDVSLREYARTLWREKWLLIIVTAFCTLSGTVGSLLVPKKYEATTVLSPVANSSAGMGGLSAAASQLGGLAALAGISVTGDSKKAESVAVLQSEALTETYIQQQNLLPVLFYKKWDSGRATWKTGDPDDKPTLWKANKLFDKQIRRVSTNAKTGLVTLSITWTDPRTAAKWANDLPMLANDYLRNKAIQESERNIAYLNSEAAKTSIVEARQAIYSILRNEIDKAMVARGSEEYSFRVIDPAVPPEKPSSPQVLLWIVGGTVFGLILSSVLAILRASCRHVQI
jgi:uncharacterized protein involved in exopolysaccharide biosynthesis